MGEYTAVHQTIVSCLCPTGLTRAGKVYLIPVPDLEINPEYGKCTFSLS